MIFIHHCVHDSHMISPDVYLITSGVLPLDQLFFSTHSSDISPGHIRLEYTP